MLNFNSYFLWQTTEESVSEAVSKSSDTVNDTAGAVNDTIFGDNYGTSPDFHFDLEEGTSVWEFVTTDSGYALVGSKNRRPWFQIVDKNGKYQMSKRYDVFGEYKSNFDPGFPPEGSFDGSAISKTKDGGDTLSGHLLIPNTQVTDTPTFSKLMHREK